MKTVICAVNSAYIHKSLALLKLSAYLENVTALEFTVNQPRDFVYNSLLAEKADVYCFSSYIWNITYIEQIAERLKKALGAVIIFGGPEAGGNAKEYSIGHPYIDYVIKGEGEISLSHLLEKIEKGENPTMHGIYRNGEGEGTSPSSKDIPMPYKDSDLSDERGRLIYYETSRGCFNKCAYCVSGDEDCLLYDEEKVKKEISHMAEFDIPLIKLVDRSFNAYGKRSERILEFLAKETKNTTFHLEVAPDLFTEKMLEIIKNAPKGKFQFEAGIQSLNEETLNAIGRICNNEKAFINLEKIISFKNSNVHLDLLAGLPKENMESFVSGFNKTYSLHPYHLDIGFLKVLKGTKAEKYAKDFGIEYESSPPYEVIRTECLSPFDLLRIKKVHNALDRIYNSKAFINTAAYLERRFETPFIMYEFLGDLVISGMSQSSLFTALLKAFPDSYVPLIYDFLASGEKKAPEGFKVIEVPKFSEKCISFISENIEKYYPHLKDVHPSYAFKKLKFYAFSEGVFMSDRESGKSFDITEKIKL